MSNRMRMFVVGLGLLVTTPAEASFHLMQIEQVIGGVNGNVSAQAIQLRMRGGLQNQMQDSRLIARDAAGLNPVLLIDMTTPVTNHGAGVRVLIASADFQDYLGVVTPDFVMPNLIPQAYLAAGSLTFEDDFGTVYWRVSWGGAGYTGSGAGATTNDVDGNFNPPVAASLPSTSGKALRCLLTSTALSTNNAANYEVTAGAAIFRNNAGAASAPVGVEDDLRSPGIVMLGAPFPNPGTGSISYAVSLERAGRVQVRVYDLSGRLVRHLVDRELAAGRHVLDWNHGSDPGGPIASGSYYLRLDAAAVQRSRRFAVVR